MSSRPPGPTHSLAHFITSADSALVSEGVRAEVKAAILGVLGTAVAGAQTPTAGRVRGLVASMSGTSSGTVAAQIWGSEATAALPFAALANGVAAQVLDWDDLSESAQAHLTVAILPASVAVAEWLPTSGRELVDAFIIGFEVATCLGRVMNPSLVERGWHATGVLGTLGATAAACRLMGASTETTGMALGIASSTASSLLINTTTETRALHAGLAARNGLEAALLANAGYRASKEAISNDLGFAQVFAGVADAAVVAEVSRLKSFRDLEHTGIILKAYPCCASAHRPVEAILELADAHGLTWDNVEDIHCRVGQLAYSKLFHHRPETLLEAKVSLPFCLSAALEDRRLAESSFAEGRLTSKDFLARMNRVHVSIHPDQLRRLQPAEEFAEVNVRLRDGATLTASVRRPRGAHDRPLKPTAIREKFRTAAESTLGPARTNACISAVEGLDEATSIRGLLRLLRPGRE